MDCREMADTLTAWIDGELDAERQTALEAHLAACSECRATADALRIQDAELVRAFSGRRQAAAALAERVADELARERRPRRSHPNLGPLFLAAAAGFLLAVIMFRPLQREPVAVSVGGAKAEPVLARLAVALGPAEILPPRQKNWAACAPTDKIAAGACVRTGVDGRCELNLSGGGAVRLNSATEVRLAQGRRIDLTQGELWSSVSAGCPPLELRTSQAVVSSGQGRLDLTCQSDETVLTVVEGSAHLRCGTAHRTIGPRERVRIVDGKIAAQEPLDEVAAATQWVIDLLALKDPDDPELAERLNGLLEQIGRAKMSHLYEDEIRRLGESAVPPLLRFLQSRAEGDDESRRAVAARIVADLAPPRSIPDLIELLGDANAEVRAAAARALSRLTARDQNFSAEQWRAEPPYVCEPARLRWQTWWEQNKHRYPGATPKRVANPGSAGNHKTRSNPDYSSAQVRHAHDA